MAVNWDDFDKDLELDAIQEEIDEAKENGLPDGEDVPDGTYEVTVKKLELKESKAGDPMLSAQLVILEGKYKGSYIFYNKVMQPQNERFFAFQIHQNNEFLCGLWDADEEDVKFNGFKDYNELVMDIFEEIQDGEWAHVIVKTTNDKGFETIEVEEVLA